MRKRRKDGLFEDFVALPWPVGLGLGIVVSLVLAQTPFKALAWVALIFGAVTASLSAIGARHRRRLLDAQTGIESLRSMSWRQFELLVGEAYRRLGYRIEETGQGGADGGIDLLIRKDGVTTLVQCKQWRSQKIGVSVVREMYGLMVHHDAHAVKIACTGTFSAEAEAFANGKPIELVGGRELLRLVEGVRAASQPTQPASALPPVPFLEKRIDHTSASAATAPSCSKCGATMVLRTNRSNGQSFWGCSKFPGCRVTVAIAPGAN